jgi:hypothetical protein
MLEELMPQQGKPATAGGKTIEYDNILALPFALI